jgi:hypothetical protein
VTGFVAADHTKKQIILAIRGSLNLSNWVADIKNFQTECADLGEPKSRCEIGFYGI